jgi:uncharacterized protein (DUF1800 family)
MALACLCTQSACVKEGRPLLDRIAYGPTPAEAARVRAIGADAYLEEQLHPETIDDSAFEARIAHLATLDMSIGEVAQRYGTGGMDMPGVPLGELVDAKILRAVYSKRQLEAVLTDFWVNHFHVRDSGISIGAYERDAIRPHVLGRFEDMLLAAARSPAMAIFLDTVMNVRDGVNGDGVERGINENYARELLELHTVGIDGGYTQEDIVEVARCFTGWNVDWNAPDGFTYIDYLHDQGPKQVMDLVLPAGGGEQDGRRVLAYLASHPNTARTIATKLVRRFVSDDPPPALVDAVAHTFLATGGDLRAVTRQVIASRELRRAAIDRTKVKRPLVLVASTARALGIDASAEIGRMRDTLALLGEYPYAANDPRGYPEDSQRWVAPGSLLGRLQFVQTAANRAAAAGVDLGVTGTEPSSELVRRLGERLGLRTLPVAEAAPIEAYAERLFGFPPETRRLEALGLVLSSSRFLTH